MESLPYRTQLSPPPFVTRSHSDAAARGYLFIYHEAHRGDADAEPLRFDDVREALEDGSDTLTRCTIITACWWTLASTAST